MCVEKKVCFIVLKALEFSSFVLILQNIKNKIDVQKYNL